MTKKLAPAKEWYNRSVDKWNTLSFTEYLKDKHEEMYGVPYVAFGGWQAEQRIIGDIIGTQSKTNPKPRKYDNGVLKEFIDVTFENYRPTKEYPGTSLGFQWKYRQVEWQRILANQNETVRENKIKDEWESIADDIDNYL